MRGEQGNLCDIWTGAQKRSEGETFAGALSGSWRMVRLGSVCIYIVHMETRCLDKPRKGKPYEVPLRKKT